MLLRILCLSSPLIVFNTWYLAYARVMGRIANVIWIQSVGAALLLGLGYLFMLPFGITGVGVAWIASQVVVAVIGALDSRDVLLDRSARLRRDAGAKASCDFDDVTLAYSPPTSAVFISPHFDDAALSCGGCITRLVDDGVPVTVLTVFTADQESGRPLSRLAKRSHASWDAEHEPFAARRAEDIAAMRVLGAERLELGMLDTIYRRSQSGKALYTSTHARLASEEIAQLVPELARRLQELGIGQDEGVRVFCPAAAADHPDHTATRLAVEQVVPRESLVLYEEYPYHVELGFGATRDSGLEDTVSDAIYLTPRELEIRIQAIGCYDSQLRGLFPTLGERVREVLSAHVPVLGRKLVRPYDVKSSRERMANRVERDMNETCGECYHWPHTAPAPYPGTRSVMGELGVMGADTP